MTNNEKSKANKILKDYTYYKSGMKIEVTFTNEPSDAAIEAFNRRYNQVKHKFI
ncbi:hypothetical protein ACQCN2_16185 [Brevibacillus ginsengisoli]|uniref:hypothetical protein n=1 Tax=Brevibacillus ginsengisoli TaxID=363854 RepID=UPI003CE8B27D